MVKAKETLWSFQKEIKPIYLSLINEWTKCLSVRKSAKGWAVSALRNPPFKMKSVGSNRKDTFAF